MPYNNKHFFIVLHVQVFLDLIFLLLCLSRAADSNKGVLFIESTSSLAMFCVPAYGRQQSSQVFHYCIKEVTVFTASRGCSSPPTLWLQSQRPAHQVGEDITTAKELRLEASKWSRELNSAMHRGQGAALWRKRDVSFICSFIHFQRTS